LSPERREGDGFNLDEQVRPANIRMQVNNRRLRQKAFADVAALFVILLALQIHAQLCNVF